MRIITGDECGLLKEVIPELSRPPTTTGSASIHSGNARPSATSIQAAAAAQMMQQQQGGGLISSSSSSAVRKIEESEEQSRQRGVISMAFVPSTTLNDDAMEDDTSLSSDFRFATLRMNGVVQLWTGSRSRGNDEGHVTPAAYKKIGLCQTVLRDVTTTNQRRSEEENENDASSSFVDGNNTSSTNNSDTTITGWSAHQPIRPIAMVSSRKHDTTNNSSNSNNPILACADSMGNISLLNSNNLQKGIVSTYNAYDLSTNQIIQAQGSKDNRKSPTSNNAVLTYTKGRYANTSICTALELCHGGTQLAVGGRERGVRVLDLESGKLIWKAKNLPSDPQTLLQQPQWTTCIQSITMDGNSGGDSGGNLLATGTAYKQVQIYDIRTSSTTRRPVLYTPEHLFTHRITSLCQLHNHTNNTTLLAIGDSTGDCHLVDMRRMHSGKQYSARKQSAKEEIGLGRLVGPGGSIRELVVHPTLPYLACVGLDRKLWTWDVNKRKMMDCVYLKQRLNCALFCGDDSWSDGGGDNNEDDEDVADEYGEVDYVPDEEWNNKRERELEKDQDEVEDYIDSDDDDDNDEAQDSGETASDSEEEDSSEGSSSSSSSSEDEEEEPTHKRGKRQKR
jgi:hypothetical protein